MQTGDPVYIFNREKNVHEKGEILRRFTVKGVKKYDIQLERGPLLEGITTDSTFTYFINANLTERINSTTR